MLLRLVGSRGEVLSFECGLGLWLGYHLMVRCWVLCLVFLLGSSHSRAWVLKYKHDCVMQFIQPASQTAATKDNANDDIGEWARGTRGLGEKPRHS